MVEGFKRYVDVVPKWTRFSVGVGSAVLMVEFYGFNSLFQPKYFYDSS